MRMKSKYAGVYAKRVVKKCKSGVYPSIFWCAKFERPGIDKKFIRHFPFTDEGELLAAQAFAAFLKKNKIKLLYLKSGRKLIATS